MRWFVSGLVAGAALVGAAWAQSAADAAKVKDAIWEKELAIYAGRAKGSVDYYAANASDDFLAWTYGAEKPFRKDTFARSSATMKGRDKEKISTTFKDFSLHRDGNTAIIYYVNHRTVMPDGTPADQTFDNIHVWIKEGGDWKVLASMSRLVEKK